MTSPKDTRASTDSEPNTSGTTRPRRLLHRSRSDSHLQDLVWEEEKEKTRRELRNRQYAHLGNTMQTVHPQDTIATIFAIPSKDDSEEPIWVTDLSNEEALQADPGDLVIGWSAGAKSTVSEAEGVLSLWWRFDYEDGSWERAGAPTGWTETPCAGAGPQHKKDMIEAFTQEALDLFKEIAERSHCPFPSSVQSRFKDVMNSHAATHRQLLDLKVLLHSGSDLVRELNEQCGSQSSDCREECLKLDGRTIVIRYENEPPVTGKSGESDCGGTSQAEPAERTDGMSMTDSKMAEIESAAEDNKVDD